jgi:proteasome lid subunit RPN8/RPN11
MAGFFWRLKEFFAAEVKQPNNYIAGKDGHIYLVKDSQLGRVVLKASNVPKLDAIQEGFEFSLPKIPSEMLRTALSFFRSYWNEEDKNEVMLRIVFDTVDKRYLFDCPEQYVQWDRVHAPNVGVDYPEPRYLDVLHIHSHHTMPAEFSDLDNLNERKYRLYVVVGQMQNPVPDVTVRVGHGGAYVYLPVDYIFDSSELSYRRDDYPKEWENRVTIIN